MDNLNNRATNILFYLALDEIKNNNIVNAYPALIKTQLLGSENTGDGFSLVDFDNYKGSFLKLSANKSIVITSKSDEGIILNDGSDYAFNFYFSYETGQDSLTLLTVNDELSLAVQQGQQAGALMLRWHGEELYIPTNDASQAAIQPSHWYNLNLLIHANGQISIALGNEETTLPDPIRVKKPYRISNVQIGGNDAEGVMNIADFYLLENLTPETLTYLIKKGVNPNLKLDWLSNISFDIYSKVEGELKKGIYITHEPTECYLRITTSKDTLKLTPLAGGGYYHVVLKFKKGFVSIKSASLTEPYQYEESTTDIVLQGKLDDNLSAIRLPDVAVVNLTGQSHTLVQCQLQHVAVNAENYSMVLEEPLYFDKKIPLYGSSGKQRCPFEILVLGDGTLLNDGETNQAITLRLCNVSEESITIPALDQNNKAGSLTIGSAHMAILEDFRRINVKIVNYTSKRSGQDLSVEITEEINLPPNAFFDITLENLIAGKPSATYPSGTYPFFLSYENIQGYANGRVPFYLKTGKIIPRDRESLFADKKLEDDVVFLKSQIHFLQEQFTLVLRNQKVATVRKNGNHDTLLLDMHVETVARKKLFTTNGNGVLEMVSTPIGTIVAYGGNNLPNGWLRCDGSFFDKNVYDKLFDVLQSSNTPDLKDKFLRGGTKENHGQEGGASEITLRANNMPVLTSKDSFVNSVGGNKNRNAGNWGGDVEIVYNVSSETKNVVMGNEYPVSIPILPPFYSVIYIIKAL